MMKVDFKRLAVIGAAGQIPRILISRVLKETEMELVLSGRNVEKRLGIEDDKIYKRRHV